MNPRWTALVGMLLPAALLLALLLAQLPADPATGVTFSNSPFTDEAWNLLGPRNWVLLGEWAAGNWSLHLVQLPFAVLEAGTFLLLGVGIVQARILTTLCTVAAVAVLTILVRRRLGGPAGWLAGFGLAGSSLVLYYGRLAYLETLVMLALVAGTAAICWRPVGLARLPAVAAGGLLAVAIGTKPSAAFASAGMLIGVAVAMRSSHWMRRTMIVAGVVALAASTWTLLIGLPNARQVGWALEIWPQQQLPSSIGELLRRIWHFPTTSDAVLMLALPLALGGAAGTIAAITRWKSLDDGQRALAGAAIGWLAAGLGVLLVASYRPNRYAVPLLPALAILTGYVAPAAEVWMHRLGRQRLAFRLVGAAVTLLVLPGLVLYGRWAVGATSRAPEIQAEVAAAMDNRPVEGGLAPLFAMRVPVPIYLHYPSEVNAGDLYGEAGVRWLVMADAYRPSWVADHPAAWDGRVPVLCVQWGRGTQCLVRLP